MKREKHLYLALINKAFQMFQKFPLITWKGRCTEKHITNAKYGCIVNVKNPLKYLEGGTPAACCDLPLCDRAYACALYSF